MRSRAPEPMKIASFNVNNINRRLANLLHWLREAEPDIACLQELNTAATEFPAHRRSPYFRARSLPLRFLAVNAIRIRWEILRACIF